MDLIISDIHANLPALQAVLHWAQRKPVRRWIILGDLVGYGAQPNQVIDAIRRLRPRFMVRGNHDKATVGIFSGENFNAAARHAVDWTHRHLRRDNLRFLNDLPEGPAQVGSDYLIAHGSPVDEDEYLLSLEEALYAFDSFDSTLCFFGHTHLPGIFELDERAQRLRWYSLEPGDRFSLQTGCRYLINPGSVGQPRDRDRRASFLEYDPQRRLIRAHRLDYDWIQAARTILSAGLHRHLAERLLIGA